MTDNNEMKDEFDLKKQLLSDHIVSIELDNELLHERLNKSKQLQLETSFEEQERD